MLTVYVLISKKERDYLSRLGKLAHDSEIIGLEKFCSKAI